MSTLYPNTDEGQSAPPPQPQSQSHSQPPPQLQSQSRPSQLPQPPMYQYPGQVPQPVAPPVHGMHQHQVHTTQPPPQPTTTCPYW